MKHVIVVGIRPGENGGIESLFLNIALGIDNHSIKYTFITAKDDFDKTFDLKIRNAGHNIVYTNSHSSSVRRILDIIKVYKMLKPDIAHINVTCGSRAFDGLFFKIINPHGKIIFHSHSNIGKRPLKYTFLIPLFHLLGNNLLGCSLEAARYFFGKRVDRKSKYVLLHNGIDTKRFVFKSSDRQRIRDEYSIDEKEPVFGYVGRLSAEKNIKYAIDLYNGYYQFAHTGYLFIVGDGEMHDSLVAYAERLELNNRVLFLGRKMEVEKYMCAMDCLLLPSLNEGLGLVMIEAQSTTLNCFASQYVPKEAFISNYAHFIDINNSPIEYSRVFDKYLNQERSNHNEFVKDSGYDINDTIERISDIYLSV